MSWTNCEDEEGSDTSDRVIGLMEYCAALPSDLIHEESHLAAIRSPDTDCAVLWLVLVGLTSTSTRVVASEKVEHDETERGERRLSVMAMLYRGM